MALRHPRAYCLIYQQDLSIFYLQILFCATKFSKRSFQNKILPHLNIKYQIAFDILISWKVIDIWFLLGIKLRANFLHILTHRVPPQCIPILTVVINCLLHILRNLHPKIVSLQSILGFHFCNYAVPILKSTRHPPSEVGIR